MKRSYGVIVEDQTDGDVIRVVIHRCVDPSVTVKVRAQKGCAKIRRKATPVINDLIAQSEVTHIIVVHDLDRDPDTKQLNDETRLRKILGECCHTHLPRLICIPVEELEAWFWADPEVVRTVGRGRGDGHPNPHLIPRPKEALQKLSCGRNARPRYSTQNNSALAMKLNLELCAKRCTSFRSLLDFVKSTNGQDRN